MAIKNSSINISVERLADGFLLDGGNPTRRKLKVVGNNFELKDASGVITLGVGASFASKVYTFPAASDTVVGVAAEQTLTNKTLTSPVINVGSDAAGDMYYRDALGHLARLAVATDGMVLTLASGLPTWSNGSLHSQNTDTGTTAGSFKIDTTNTSYIDLQNYVGSLYVRNDLGDLTGVHASSLYADSVVETPVLNLTGTNVIKFSIGGVGSDELNITDPTGATPRTVNAGSVVANGDVVVAAATGHLTMNNNDIDASQVAFLDASDHLVGNAKFLYDTATDTLKLLSGANLIVNGDLTVQGTTTYLNSTNTEIVDKNIEIGKVATPTDATADGGGITLKGTTDKTIIWDNATDNWTLNQNVNIPTSYEYKINNVPVLSATALGSTVVSSSLTSVGTITSGTWHGDVVGLPYGGTGKNMTAVAGGVVYTDADSMEVTAAGTSGQVLVSNGSSAPSFKDVGLVVPAYQVLTANATIDAATSSLKKIVSHATPATQLVITIAADLPVGREVVVAGLSAGGWRIVAAASSGVKFVFGDVESAADGNISSTHNRDTVTLVKCSATEIMVVSAVGNLELDQA